MAAYFVTSTGTDIGKTFVTAALIRYLRESNQPVQALKPVVSGYDASVAETSDPAVLLDALGRPVTAEEVNRIAPWRFRAPLSPDLAAAREGRRIDFDELIKFSRTAIDAATGPLFIEGVGGIMAGSVIFGGDRTRSGGRAQQSDQEKIDRNERQRHRHIQSRRKILNDRDER